MEARATAPAIRPDTILAKGNIRVAQHDERPSNDLETTPQLLPCRRDAIGSAAGPRMAANM
jgi:hypothetical protein